MGVIDWVSLFGILGAIIVIIVRAGIGINDVASSVKNMIHDDVKVPVNKLSDKVDKFSVNLHDYMIRESEDHRNLMDIMGRSGKTRRKILKISTKLNKVQDKNVNQDKVISNHTAQIAKHDRDINSLKANGGNHK